MGIIAAGLLSERRSDVREKRNIDEGIHTVCIYMLWDGLRKQSHHLGCSVKLRNAKQHPGDWHPLSLLIDIILGNDNKLQDVCYSNAVLIFYTLFTMKCYNCSLPKEESLAICLLISIL